jgi:hypothetical protein
VVNLRRLDLGPGLRAEGDQIVGLDDQLAEMIAMRDEGKIGAIGISAVRADVLKRALPAGRGSFRPRHRTVSQRLAHCGGGRSFRRATAGKRGDTGHCRQGDRDKEYDRQAVMERQGDEMREEFAAGDRGQILGRKMPKHTGRGEQVLKWIDTEDRREQRRHRRQLRHLSSDVMRHTVAL